MRLIRQREASELFQKIEVIISLFVRNIDLFHDVQNAIKYKYG